MNNMNNMNNILIKSILLFIFIIFLKKISIDTYENSQELPKIIWSYWNDKELPDLIKMCIKSWKYHNPDWTINILTDDNLKDFLPELNLNDYKFIDSVTRKSDLIRIFTLCKYGGVWCDASIIFKSNLNWLLDIFSDKQKEFFSFHIGAFNSISDYPVIENWFFACLPNSKFINLWKNAFLKINKYDSLDEYLNDMKNTTDFQKIDAPNYLAMHIAAQYVLQNLFTIDEIKLKLSFLKAEDGPFLYLSHNNWDSTLAILDICKNLKTKYNNINIIKLRGIERNTISNNKELECIYEL